MATNSKDKKRVYILCAIYVVLVCAGFAMAYKESFNFIPLIVMAVGVLLAEKVFFRKRKK